MRVYGPNWGECFFGQLATLLTKGHHVGGPGGQEEEVQGESLQVDGGLYESVNILKLRSPTSLGEV